MNLNFNILGLLNSGGEAQAIIPNIQGYSKDLTTADVFATDSGASTYTFQRSTSSDMSSPTEVQSGASRTLNDTGLTAGVTYYYRVKGEGAWSNIISVTTVPYSPMFWIEGSGLSYGVSNAYGNLTNSNIDLLKSIINTSLTFSPASSVMAMRLAEYKYPSGVIINVSTAGYIASGAVAPGLDFTMVLPMYINVTMVNHCFASSDGSANTLIRSTMTTLLLSFGGGSKVFTYTTPLVVGKWYDLIIQGTQNGTACDVRVSIDGGATWTAIQSYAAATGGPQITRLLSSSTGGNNINISFKRFVLFNRVLTTGEIGQVLNYGIGSTFVPRANTATVPKNLTFANTLAANGIIINSELDNVCTASYVRDRSWVIGDYFYQLVNKKEDPYYALDMIYVINLATGKYCNPIELAVYNANVLDYHASGSLAPMRDNTFEHYELNSHYDFQNFRKVKVRRFGDALDMSSQTELPIDADMGGDIFYMNNQYFQFSDFGNERVAFAHRPYTTSGTDVSINMMKSSDGFNSGTDARVAAAGIGNWFYHKLVYREDGVMELFLNHYLFSSTRYDYLFAIRSVDRGVTWQNFSGSFSKDIQSGFAPVTLAELVANCVVKDASALAEDAMTYHVGYDPATGETFGLTLDGSNTGIQMFRWSGGSWNLVNVDFGATAMNYSGIDEAYDPHFFIIKTGVNSFTVGAASSNGGNNNQIVLVKTTDNGATWSAVSVFSTDDTKRFQRFYPNRNVQYSTRKVISGTVEVSSTEGSLFVKQL